MRKLAIVLRELGEYAEAKKYHKKALAIEEKHYSALYFSRMSNLEVALIVLGVYTLVSTCYSKVFAIKEYESAKKYLKKALLKTQQHNGGNDPNSAVTMHNLGNLCNDLGDYASAKTYYEKALAIKRKCYGDAHPNTAVTMHNLGNVLVRLGKYAEAQPFLKKVLKIKENYYGTTDPSTANTMENLGLAFTNLGQFEEA